MSDEQHGKVINSFIELYISVFKINKLSFINNTKQYSEDSKKYNMILNELSILNSKINVLNSKVDVICKYNREINL